MYKKMKFYGGTVASFIMLLFLFPSCGNADLFDGDKWSNEVEGWEPNVSLKVLHGSFTLWDLINQGADEVIAKEGNDLVIQYTEEDIFRIGIEDVFDMPKESLAFGYSYSIPGASAGTYVLPDPLEIGMEIASALQHVPDGCELKKMEFSARFVLPEIGCPYQIEVEFPDIERNGETLRIERSVAAGESAVEELGDCVLALGAAHSVSLKARIVIPAGSAIASPDLNLTFGLNDLAFKKAEGKIVADPIEIVRGSFDMDVDFLNEIGGEFKFAEPELSVIIRNKGIGIPMSVEAVFDGENAGGEKVSLKLNDGERLMTQGNPSNLWSSDTLGLNKDNSNIVDFLSLPPTGDIFYRGTVCVNPDGRDDNVVYSDGEIALDAYVRVPFKLSASGLNYRDTLNDIDIDSQYADKIKEGIVTITAVNELPLNLQVPTLVLLDANDGRLADLSAEKGRDTIKPSSGGEESVLEFKLSEEDAKKLGETERILLEVVAFTPDNQVVAVAADAKISFDLKIVAKAVITDLDDL